MDRVFELKNEVSKAEIQRAEFYKDTKIFQDFYIYKNKTKKCFRLTRRNFSSSKAQHSKTLERNGLRDHEY